MSPNAPATGALPATASTAAPTIRQWRRLRWRAQGPCQVLFDGATRVASSMGPQEWITELTGTSDTKTPCVAYHDTEQVKETIIDPTGAPITATIDFHGSVLLRVDRKGRRERLMGTEPDGETTLTLGGFRNWEVALNGALDDYEGARYDDPIVFDQAYRFPMHDRTIPRSTLAFGADHTEVAFRALSIPSAGQDGDSKDVITNVGRPRHAKIDTTITFTRG